MDIIRCVGCHVTGIGRVRGQRVRVQPARFIGRHEYGLHLFEVLCLTRWALLQMLFFLPRSAHSLQTIQYLSVIQDCFLVHFLVVNVSSPFLKTLALPHGNGNGNGNGGGGGGGPDICGPQVCPEQMTRGVSPTSASHQHAHLLCALGLGFRV